MTKLYIWNIRAGHEDYENLFTGWGNGPDIAGGITVKWSFKNNTEKSIKYASFFFVPYNAVGDTVVCTISGKSYAGVKITGPIAPGESKLNVFCSNPWYNYSITKFDLTHVFLEYMDGTSETVDLDEIAFSEPSGCYIATAVYGSYDCPQVWTLRRYRDGVLAKNWFGRASIKMYYVISPIIIKWFGHTQWFNNFWRKKLDVMVEKLHANGIESTPYEDTDW